MRLHRFALRTYLIIFISLCWTGLPRAEAAGPDRTHGTGGLTLAEALSRAAANRPELADLRTDLDAAAIKLNHAGLPPNPELGVEWDNLGGELPDDDVKETTLSLSQPLEIGGKASARMHREQNERNRLQCELTTTWLDIAVEVKTTFLELLGARERLTLQQEAERIAAELAAITHERVAAGELAATEEIRAEARRAETTAETLKLKRSLTEAELNLAAAMAEPETVTGTASGQLAQEIAIPERKTLLAGLDNSPLSALRRSEGELAEAGLALEKANAWSDPALSVAVREIPDKDARAVLVGISIPLPLFQRNQAALAEAGAAMRKASTREEASIRQLRTDLIKAHTILIAADQEAHTLRDEVVTRATAAADAVREGFRYGKFRYSDVLEASQSLVAAKARHLEAILDLNRAAIALDRLLGNPSLPTPAQVNPLSSLHRSQS